MYVSLVFQLFQVRILTRFKIAPTDLSQRFKSQESHRTPTRDSQTEIEDAVLRSFLDWNNLCNNATLIFNLIVILLK